MRHAPLGAQLGDSLESWGHTRWVVQMHVTNRQMVETVNATAYRTRADGVESEGFNSTEVGPFDDLRIAIQTALLESALDALEPWEGFEQTLPYDPFDLR